MMMYKPLVKNYVDPLLRKGIHKIVKIINVLTGYKIWHKEEVPEI